MGKKKSSFDNIASNFSLDGHDTIIHETEIRSIDKKQKSKMTPFGSY